MKKIHPLALPWMVSLCLLQCASVAGRQVETRTIWESGEGYVRLFREVGTGNRYDHPQTFHEADMARILASVYYSTHRFFRWSPSTRVFEDEQAARLAPHFQRAFLDAGPEELVEFYLPRAERTLLGVSGGTSLTRGRAFVRGRKLHIHLDNVQQKVRSYATHAEDQEPLPPSGWKFVPTEGQSFGTEGPAGRVKKENLHWLAIDLSAFSGAPPLTQPPPAALAAPSPGERPSAAERPSGGAALNGEPPIGPEAPPAPFPAPRATEALRALKAMQEEGLISPEDYDRKKREILDRF